MTWPSLTTDPPDCSAPWYLQQCQKHSTVITQKHCWLHLSPFSPTCSTRTIPFPALPQTWTSSDTQDRGGMERKGCLHHRRRPATCPVFYMSLGQHIPIQKEERDQKAGQTVRPKAKQCLTLVLHRSPKHYQEPGVSPEHIGGGCKQNKQKNAEQAGLVVPHMSELGPPACGQSLWMRWVSGLGGSRTLQHSVC